MARPIPVKNPGDELFASEVNLLGDQFDDEKEKADYIIDLPARELASPTRAIDLANRKYITIYENYSQFGDVVHRVVYNFSNTTNYKRIRIVVFSNHNIEIDFGTGLVIQGSDYGYLNVLSSYMLAFNYADGYSILEIWKDSDGRTIIRNLSPLIGGTLPRNAIWPANNEATTFRFGVLYNANNLPTAPTDWAIPTLTQVNSLISSGQNWNIGFMQTHPGAASPDLFGHNYYVNFKRDFAMLCVDGSDVYIVRLQFGQSTPATPVLVTDKANTWASVVLISTTETAPDYTWELRLVDSLPVYVRELADGNVWTTTPIYKL